MCTSSRLPPKHLQTACLVDDADAAKPRDMHKELLEWRREKSTRKSAWGNENASRRWQAPGDGAPKTPVKRRGHVSAVSPLMEVCSNCVQSTGGQNRCRPSASSYASPQLVYGGSPHSPATSSAAVADGLEAGADCWEEGANQDTFVTPAGAGADLFELELIAWEEAALEPAAPAPSPATPSRGLKGRNEEAHCLSIAGFLHGLPRTLAVAFGSDSVEGNRTSVPVQRSLHSCLQQAEVAEDATCVEALEPASLKEEPSPSVFGNQMPPEPEVDELCDFFLAVENHQPWWPAQTALEMEDHLSRAYDIVAFAFLERRELANHRASHDRPAHIREELVRIPEYPSSWQKWQVSSSHSRSAMRARRRSLSGTVMHANDIELIL